MCIYIYKFMCLIIPSFVYSIVKHIFGNLWDISDYYWANYYGGIYNLYICAF